MNFQFKQSFLSNVCGLDKPTIPPVNLQLSTTLYRPSWAAVHNTFPVRVLASFTHLPVVTLSDNDGKQNRSGDKLSHVGFFNTKNFFSEGQKKLVNSENKENFSNYQLLKRKL